MYKQQENRSQSLLSRVSCNNSDEHVPHLNDRHEKHDFEGPTKYEEQ